MAKEPIGEDGLTATQRYKAKNPERVRVLRRAHYLKHREDRLRRAKARQERNREIVRVAKDVPCVDCGERYPTCVMDLDHVRGTKNVMVSHMLMYSVARLQEEIAKCDVRCANCHRLRHAPGKKET